MTPVVYEGPHVAVTVAGGTLCRRNTPADVDDALAARLLDRGDFRGGRTATRAPVGDVPERTADGPGPLPPLPDSAYPPDATPLATPDAQED